MKVLDGWYWYFAAYHYFKGGVSVCGSHVFRHPKRYLRTHYRTLPDGGTVCQGCSQKRSKIGNRGQ